MPDRRTHTHTHDDQQRMSFDVFMKSLCKRPHRCPRSDVAIAANAGWPVIDQWKRSANTLSHWFIDFAVIAGVITVAAKPPFSGVRSGVSGGTSGRAGR